MTRIFEVKNEVGFVKEHGLDNYFMIYDLENEIFLKTEYINGEYWYNCYTSLMDGDYVFSSLNIKECLDFLNVIYYDGPEYR